LGWIWKKEFGEKEDLTHSVYKRIQGKLNTFWNKHWDIVIAVVVGFMISQIFLLWLLK
jgi:hypothetical protein